MFLLDVIAQNLHRPLFIAVLVLPTTRPQRLVALLVILLADWHTYLILLKESSLKGFGAYSEPAGMLGPVMLSLELLLMTKDPRRSVKWLHTDAGANPPDDSPYDTYAESKAKASQAKGAVSLTDENIGVFQRIVLATSLAFNPRCIGTNVQVANVVPLSPNLVSSRKNFYLHRLFIGVTGVLRLLALYLAATRFPFVKEAVLAAHPTLVQRVVHTAGGISTTYLILNSGHCLLSVAAVALRLSKPEDWPNLFGALTDAYTVRRAWG